MGSMNAENFAIFGNSFFEQDLGLRQAVRDHVLTIRGRRLYHPTYGTYARLHPGRISRLALDKSLLESLHEDPRVHRVAIFEGDNRILHVVVNNQDMVTVGQ